MTRKQLEEIEARAAVCAEATIPGWQLRNLVEMGLCLCEVVEGGNEVGLRYNNPIRVHWETFDRWNKAVYGPTLTKQPTPQEAP